MKLEDVLNENTVEIYDSEILFDIEAGTYLDNSNNNEEFNNNNNYISTALIVVDISNKDMFDTYQNFFIHYLDSLKEAYSLAPKNYEYSLNHVKMELKDKYFEILDSRKMYKIYAVGVARNLGLLIPDDVDIIYPEHLAITDDWYDYIITHVVQLHIYCHKQTKFYEIINSFVSNKA